MGAWGAHGGTDDALTHTHTRTTPPRPAQMSEISEGLVDKAILAMSAPPLPWDDGKVPVLVVCGWLGSGKTTLLEHLLTNADGLRIGVLVNDMASVNVDANTLARVVHAKDEMIEFSNGAW